MEQIEHPVTFLVPYIPCLIQFFTSSSWSLVFLSPFYSCGMEGSLKLNNSFGVVEYRFEPRTPQRLSSLWSFPFQVDGITMDWHTPLFNACVSGSQDCVNLLLQHGASLCPVSELASPIHEAAKRGKATVK